VDPLRARGETSAHFHEDHAEAKHINSLVVLNAGAAPSK
jgi:hypothetical protein